MTSRSASQAVVVDVSEEVRSAHGGLRDPNFRSVAVPGAGRSGHPL